MDYHTKGKNKKGRTRLFQACRLQGGFPGGSSRGGPKITWVGSVGVIPGKPPRSVWTLGWGVESVQVSWVMSEDRRSYCLDLEVSERIFNMHSITL